MAQYVIFFNNETWVIIEADEFIIDAVNQTIDLYKDHEMIASFSMIKTIGFTRYEYALMQILKNQKVCNGFEAIKQPQPTVFDKMIDEIEHESFHDANGVIYCGFNRVRQIIEKYKGGADNGK